MENLNVAIVSSDKAYNKALMLSLTNACRDITVKTFDSRQFIREWSEYTGKGAFYNTFDLVLWSGEEISESYGDNIVYLTDKTSLLKKDYANNRFCIYKYSSANTMLAAIFDIYSHLTGRTDSFVHREGVRLIGFAASSGGAGCTTLAMAVGQELCRFHNKRVMYISFENVESTGTFIPVAPGTKSLPEFLYRLLGNTAEKLLSTPESIPFLEGYLIRSPFGLGAFPPVSGKNPLPELDCEDIRKFLGAIIDSGRFDVILLDFATCVTEASIAAMSMAERICYTATPGNSGLREENYLSQIICRNGERALEKMIKIENMHKRGAVMRDDVSDFLAEEEMLPAGGYVSSFSRERRGSGEIILEGAFGMDVARLANMLMEPTEIM